MPSLRRVLILAYEYPPILAAQSLRWFYLANVLAEKNDLEVHVLTTDIRDVWGFAGQPHPRLHVHRIFPGPFVGLAGYLARRLPEPTAASSSASLLPAAKVARVPAMAAKAYGWTRTLLDHLLFPDVRTEWLPFARRALRRLRVGESFQVVISSHEPGVDLLLGRDLKRRYPGLYWIVDLADPLLTPYTPRWRRAWDRRLEGQVCREADRVLVTNRAVKHALVARHGPDLAPFLEITQGFCPPAAAVATRFAEFVDAVLEPGRRFTLLFTGNFYPGFRDPGALLQALSHLPEIRLVVAGGPGAFAKDFAALQGQVKTLGRLDHFRCLALQQAATVLVDLGNAQADQIPGKLYEYLGAARPILHISQTDEDEGGRLIRRLGRGETVANTAAAIERKLASLFQRWREGRIDQGYDLSLASVAEHSWDRLGERLYRGLPGAVPRSDGRGWQE